MCVFAALSPVFRPEGWMRAFAALSPVFRQEGWMRAFATLSPVFRPEGCVLSPHSVLCSEKMWMRAFAALSPVFRPEVWVRAFAALSPVYRVKCWMRVFDSVLFKFHLFYLINGLEFNILNVFIVFFPNTIYYVYACKWLFFASLALFLICILIHVFYFI